MSTVAIVPCGSYDDTIVFESVKEGIRLLGGMDKFIGKGEKILLKPNLLNRVQVSRGVTTHPAVFSAVARLLREEGYDNITYGDSPGHPGSAKKTAEVCGIATEADKHDIPMADFSNSSTVEYNHGRVKRKYEICEGVLDADAIINICKMKTHQLERITGAVKNLFGCVCGLNKAKAHAKFPDPESFAQMLVELNMILEPRLHVMDGIIAMEGNGPASGDPVNMDVLLFSDDPVALDAVFCMLIDLDPRQVPTVYFGEKFELGKKNREDIDIVGVASIESYIRKDFNVEREQFRTKGGFRLLENLRLVSKRPVIDESKCIRCGACITACPVEIKAIFFDENDNGSAPKYDYSRCIRCYCCQEMCPEGAISVKLGFGK